MGVCGGAYLLADLVTDTTPVPERGCFSVGRFVCHEVQELLTAMTEIFVPPAYRMVRGHELWFRQVASDASALPDHLVDPFGVNAVGEVVDALNAFLADPQVRLGVEFGAGRLGDFAAAERLGLVFGRGGVNDLTRVVRTGDRSEQFRKGRLLSCHRNGTFRCVSSG